MPTYDYQCLGCGDDFELFQKMSDAAIRSCPKCKGKVKRLIGTGSGLIFKGSGFYATDYKKPAAPACSDCKQSVNCPHADKKSEPA